MTALQAQALLPFFVLTGGIVALLMLVAWLRSEAVAFGGSLLVMLASLVALPSALATGVQNVDGIVQVDGYAVFFFALFALAGMITAVLVFRYLPTRAAHRQEFYILLTIAVLGATVTAAATNFAGFLLGIEVLSVSLYAMIAYPENAKPPLEASAKYLVLSGAASSTILFGMALIYLATGTIGFSFAGADLATGDRNILLLGQALLLGGVFFKLSLVPFHMWTPDVYQGAPAPVTGFVATVSKGAVFAVLLRYALDADLLEAEVIRTIVVVVAVLSMIGGNLLALLQTNLKRLLAYSSIAHVGYLLVALMVAGAPGGNPALGVETAIVYLAGYFLMTLTAFGVVAVLSGVEEEAEELETYEGLLWRRPLLAAILVAVALSLAGIPLTVGFIAKFYAVAAGVASAAWMLIWALLIGSAIGVYYYLRIVFAMTRRPEPSAGERDGVTPRVKEPSSEDAVPASAERSIPWEGVCTVAVLGLAILALGVYPSPLVDVVRGLTGP